MGPPGLGSLFTLARHGSPRHLLTRPLPRCSLIVTGSVARSPSCPRVPCRCPRLALPHPRRRQVSCLFRPVFLSPAPQMGAAFWQPCGRESGGWCVPSAPSPAGSRKGSSPPFGSPTPSRGLLVHKEQSPAQPGGRWAQALAAGHREPTLQDLGRGWAGRGDSGDGCSSPSGVPSRLVSSSFVLAVKAAWRVHLPVWCVFLQRKGFLKQQKRWCSRSCPIDT